jgi:hypothetical protein
MKSALIVLALVLSGCATCQEHPVACGVSAALIAGSIAASSLDHSGGGGAAPAGRSTIGAPNCSAGGCQ